MSPFRLFVTIISLKGLHTKYSFSKNLSRSQTGALWLPVGGAAWLPVAGVLSLPISGAVCLPTGGALLVPVPGAVYPAY